MRRTLGIMVATTLVIAAMTAGALAQQLRVWPHTRDEFIELSEAFAAAHPEIQTIIEPGSVSNNDRMGTAIAAGLSPDVSATTRLDRLFLGWVTPLNDYFERSDVAREFLASGSIGAHILQSAIEQYSFKGDIIALPTGWSYPVLGLYQNRDMFEAAGIAVIPPDVAPTWDEIADLHKKLTRIAGDGQIEQLGFPAVNRQLYPPNLAYSFGIPLVDPDGSLNIEGLVRGYTFMRENFVEFLGYENIIAFLGGAEADHTPVVSQNAAMALAPARGTHELGGLDLALAYAPHVDSKKVSYVGGIFWQLNNPLVNRDEAYKFLDFTLTYMPFHETSFMQNGRMGAPGFNDLVRLTGMIEEENPAGAWFIRSMAEAEELYWGLVAPWAPEFDATLNENDRITRIWDGTAPIRATLEEVQRIVSAKYAESPWYSR